MRLAEEAEPLLPARRRLQNAPVISADSAGFRQRAETDSGGDTLSCDAVPADLSNQPAGTVQNRSTVETTTRRCRRRTALPVQEAAPGSLFVIGQGGRPMLRVIPLDADRQQAPPWRLGLLAGLCEVPDDFGPMAASEIADL